MGVHLWGKWTQHLFQPLLPWLHRGWNMLVLISPAFFAVLSQLGTWNNEVKPMSDRTSQKTLLFTPCAWLPPLFFPLWIGSRFWLWSHTATMREPNWNIKTKPASNETLNQNLQPPNSRHLRHLFILNVNMFLKKSPVFISL